MTTPSAPMAWGQGRVLEALPLGNAGSLGREVDDVGGQAFGRQFEGGACAGGILVEEVDHGTSTQRGKLLDGAVTDLGQFGGCVEDQKCLVPTQVTDGEQMSHQALPSAVPVRGREGPRRTASWPSVSSRRTSTLSRKEVGRFLPT